MQLSGLLHCIRK